MPTSSTNGTDRTLITEAELTQLAALDINPNSDYPPRALNTLRAYATWWRKWQADGGTTKLPIKAEALGDWLEQLATRYPKTTCGLAYQALRYIHGAKGHPIPDCTYRIDRIRRHRTPAEPKRATGLRGQHLKQIQRTDTRPEIIALIALMRNAMLRRGEMAAVQTRHLEKRKDGTGLLYIPYSKTDQRGTGTRLEIAPYTMRLIHQAELLERPATAQLIPLTDRNINANIKAAAAKAKLPGHYTGHSPRIGMAQDLRAAGKSILEIQLAGRWRSPAMVEIYTRLEGHTENSINDYFTQHPDG